MKSNVDYGLSLNVIHKIQAVFSAYLQIEKVWIYGSRAIGNYQPASDIDLCIESLTLEFSQLLTIENQLDELLLPWKIDLSLKKSIDNPALLEHIRQHGKVFYSQKSPLSRG